MNEPVRRKAILALLAIFGGVALAVFAVVYYMGGA